MKNKAWATTMSDLTAEAMASLEHSESDTRVQRRRLIGHALAFVERINAKVTRRQALVEVLIKAAAYDQIRVNVEKNTRWDYQLEEVEPLLNRIKRKNNTAE